MTERVFVTGMGSVTPFGIGVEKLWSSMSNNELAIRPIHGLSSRSEEFRCKVGGQIPEDFKIADHLPKLNKKIDPFQAYSIIASDLAIKNSKINLEKTDRSRFGVSSGSSNGGVGTGLKNYKQYLEKGLRGVSPFTGVRYTVNGASAWPAIHFGLEGPNESFSVTCATGNTAIGNAYRKIKHGHADLMLAGSSDYFDEFIVVFFHRARAVAATKDPYEVNVLKPFDKNRSGTILSEGCGMLLLESESSTRKRDARVYAEILGMGETCDARNIVAPDTSGRVMTRAIQNCLEESNLKPEEIEYVSAHGTGTLFNDPTEVKALKNALGEHVKSIPVSAPKSQLGHLLGASSSVEAICGIMGGLNNTVTPTLNLENPDPKCDLDHVPQKARKHEYRTFLNNSFGFGGHNCVLAIRTGDPED